MDKRDNYRIITNDERFRIQELKRFLCIKWWMCSSKRILKGAFYRSWDAERALERHLDAERLWEQQKVQEKKGKKGPWRPVGKEN